MVEYRIREESKRRKYKEKNRRILNNYETSQLQEKWLVFIPLNMPEKTPLILAGKLTAGYNESLGWDVSCEVPTWSCLENMPQKEQSTTFEKSELFQENQLEMEYSESLDVSRSVWTWSCWKDLSEKEHSGSFKYSILFPETQQQMEHLKLLINRIE